MYTKHETREAWLADAAGHLRARFKDVPNATPTERVQYLVSWPYKSSDALGQHFPGKYWTEDKTSYITVSPVLGNPVQVLDTVLHELVHACGISDHGEEFKRVATAVGLTGCTTSTVPTDECRAELEELAKKLGPYPHEPMKLLHGMTRARASRVRLDCAKHPDYTVELPRKRFEAGEQLPPLCPHCREPMRPQASS